MFTGVTRFSVATLYRGKLIFRETATLNPGIERYYREHSQILYDILLIFGTIFHRLYPLFTSLAVAPRGVVKSLRGCEKSILYKILH